MAPIRPTRTPTATTWRTATRSPRRPIPPCSTPTTTATPTAKRSSTTTPTPTTRKASPSPAALSHSVTTHAARSDLLRAAVVFPCVCRRRQPVVGADRCVCPASSANPVRVLESASRPRNAAYMRPGRHIGLPLQRVVAVPFSTPVFSRLRGRLHGVPSSPGRRQDGANLVVQRSRWAGQADA